MAGHEVDPPDDQRVAVLAVTGEHDFHADGRE
jgi:hypothetical protein